ncbi:unnamed protein product [Adineta steineri]|uniref:B30.2/SPRY domain-containing protein n=1 Tax=Adineta steineri TaxID=433720 RepID=A0A813VP53_9BILA|nr:unnamed protein product [Adineta steineri]
MKDNTNQENTSVEPNLQTIEDLPREEQKLDESPSSKKRHLPDDDIEKVEESEDNSLENPNNDIEKDDENTNSDDILKQKRKKKSRWGSEQDEEESQEKQSTSKQTSDDDDDDDRDDHNDDDDDNNNNSSRHRERDHHRSSRQHDDDRHYSSRRSEKSTEREIPLPEEEIVQFNNDDVVLDFYTSDLNLTINTDCLSASNKSNDALCFLWAGIRATYGFKQGKICYEIRVTEIIDCPQMPESEKEKFGIRIGWSNLSSGLHALQLGEFNDSFAYASTGKKLSTTNTEFMEDTYGESFGLSDVIACYIDFGDDDNLIRISFTKNGEDYGQAFEFSKTNSIEFYPHILVKNVKFECNFGQIETPWSEIKSEYIFVQNIPLSDRIRTCEPILEKNQCEIILLSGLNGSGKTTWAKKHIEENPKKDFNLLNIEYVLSKMTIDGKLPVIKDRNDGLMLRVNICLQKLIEIAAQRRRNFIIDHVNITRETQSKRQRLFTGYQRIGVAIIPDEDELKRRIEKLEKNENITIPLQWIKEAKAKFNFPQKSTSLEDVIYPELSYDDAKLVYDKIRRDYDQYRSSSRSDRHDDYHSSRNNNNNSRNRYDDRDRRSGDRDRDRDRNRDRYARSRSRDRDRRTSREDSRFSSSHRNDNYRGGYSRGGGSGGSSSGGGRYSDQRQDSRNNQRGGFHEGGGNYRGRGGNYNNQSNDDRRGGYQQRNEFGGGRGRGGGGFDNNRNQYNNRGSFQDKQRGGGGGFRQEFNNPQRGRQFNSYDNNQQQQGGGGGSRGFMQNNNNSFNQQRDRQNFDSRPPMQQQQQHSFQNQQQRPQPLLHNPTSNQQQPYSSHMAQQTLNNPNLSLQAQNPLGINSLSNAANITQQSSLDPWLALCAAALNPQAAAPQQPQQDTNSLTQQWAQWLKTAQMAQTAQQSHPQLSVQQLDSQQQQQQQQQQQAQIPDASALYYQAYYAQLAAAQQQAAAAAAAAAGSMNGGVAPPGSSNK